MKKIFSATLLSIALFFVFGLTACTQKGVQSADGGKFGELTTAGSVYGFSAASAGMLISASNGGQAAALAAAKGYPAVSAADPADEQTAAPSDPAQTEETPADVSELDRYMSLVESLLSDGGFRVTEQPSDREGYTDMSVVTYRDLEGNTLEYVMYFDKTVIPDDDDDDDRHDDETEENYSIEGVLVIDGTDYRIRGVRESETEWDETESETEFRVELGENRYMLVEQSFETEDGETEQEYSYSLLENGSRVERSTFEYENENGETEVKMTSFKNGVSQSFYFERETVRGQEILRLRIGSGQEAQSYYVRPAADGNGYEYEPISRS